MGSEVEAMQMQWNRSGSEEENSGACRAEGLHYQSESSSKQSVIQT